MSKSKPLSVEQVASAIGYVTRLDRDGRVKLADKIFEDQPAVLGAVVQLHSLGVDFPTQEHAVHVLLVLYECFTRHVPGLPKITEATVQAAFDNNSANVEVLRRRNARRSSTTTKNRSTQAPGAKRAGVRIRLFGGAVSQLQPRK